MLQNFMFILFQSLPLFESTVANLPKPTAVVSSIICHVDCRIIIINWLWHMPIEPVSWGKGHFQCTRHLPRPFNHTQTSSLTSSLLRMARSSPDAIRVDEIDDNCWFLNQQQQQNDVVDMRAGVERWWWQLPSAGFGRYKGWWTSRWRSGMAREHPPWCRYWGRPTKDFVVVSSSWWRAFARRCEMWIWELKRTFRGPNWSPLIYKLAKYSKEDYYVGPAPLPSAIYYRAR